MNQKLIMSLHLNGQSNHCHLSCLHYLRDNIEEHVPDITKNRSDYNLFLDLKISYFK